MYSLWQRKEGNKNKLFVINGTNNTEIKSIDVGVKKPLNFSSYGETYTTIAINKLTNLVYVINSKDNTISVINGTNNTKIPPDIVVGKFPLSIAFNDKTNKVYVANRDSNGVSVIDGETTKLVLGIIFQVKPFNSGYIICDKSDLSPISQYFFVLPNTQCTAKSYNGFEFLSWEENITNNSTKVLNVSRPASTLESLKNLFGIKSDEPEAKLNITKFGSFTANFKELPPPLPKEYWATLFTVVVTAFISSWLTPTIIGWRKAKKQGNKLDHYHIELKKLYNDGKLDRNDIEELDNLRNNIRDEYVRGKINKEQYDKLGSEISVSYREIFNKEIDSLNTLSENNKINLLDKINNDISDSYPKEKINELHYNLLKEKTSKLENNNINDK